MMDIYISQFKLSRAIFNRGGGGTQKRQHSLNVKSHIYYLASEHMFTKAHIATDYLYND